MNRRMTGWLAWGALALVIGVPSADLMFSTPETSVSVAAVDAGKQPFFGPMPAKNTNVTDVFEAPVARPLAAKTPAAGVVPPKVVAPEAVVTKPVPVVPAEAESSTETAAAAEPEKADPAPLKLGTEPAVETKAVAAIEQETPQQKGAAMTPVVPMAIRVVGDQGMAPLPVKPVPEAGKTAVEPAKADADPASGTTELAAIPEAAGQAIAPVELRGSDNKTLKVAVTPPVTEPVTALAPKPLPASLRPPEPVRTSRSVATFEEEVRASIDNVRAGSRRAPAYGDPVYPVYDDYSEDAPVWGDDPRLRRGQQLESFAPGDFAEDDPSDSEFYEVWRQEQRPAGFTRSGSFEEQLPARRGSAVRMDLLQ